MVLLPRLLKRLRISSVDLCRRGANPLARVALSKSDAGEELRAQLMELAGAELTPEELLDALARILEQAHATSADESEGEVETETEPHDADSESTPADTATGAVAVKADRQSGAGQRDVQPAVQNAHSWAARLMGWGKARHGAAPTAREEYSRMPVHPEVRRALEEVRALRDALAQERATAVAKRYEGVCDEPDALAGRLARLRALDGEAYGDYVALLDELAEARRIEPFMKEYGSSRSAGGVLDARVAEIMRADPKLTRAQAVVRAYQSDPDIPEVL